MIVKIADNIISPLGFTTQDNYNNVKQGRSLLRRYVGKWHLPEPFVASLLDREEVEQKWQTVAHNEEYYTFWEKIAILSASAALKTSNVNVADERVLFVFSSTKGNVSLLDRTLPFPGSEKERDDRISPAGAADKVCHYFGNKNVPVVVCNACISGVCAQIVASRALRSGRYDYVIVVGAEEQSPFIISGFQSFKALAEEECRPFDINRQGLNLGEAAATIIYAAMEQPVGWCAVNGVIRNDANHISGPSRNGEGSYRALQATLQSSNLTADQLACLNVHGTATLYNDEMECQAIKRAKLEEVPVNALKGYYGHTMGAAGIMESILTMRAIDDHTILATRGYNQCGVSYPLNINKQPVTTDKTAFVKLLSGFGGCNAALAFQKQ